MKPPLFLIGILIFSCNLKTEKSAAIDKPLSPISLWLSQNEDSLFRSLSEWVKTDTTQNKPEGELQSREYVLNEGIFASLNDKVRKIANCITVIYIFKPNTFPYFEIFLTPEFDTACINSTDSIFSDIYSLRHFRVTKYKPPIGPFSKYIMDADTLEVSDIAFKLIQSNGKYDITIYLKKPTFPETKEQLKNNIFGEKFLLKQVRSVKFLQLTDTVRGAKTVDELRRLLDLTK